MRSLSQFALFVFMASLPRFKSYEETFCLKDLCGLEHQVREICPELSGDEIMNGLICRPDIEERNKVCTFECSSTERSYEDTIFVLRQDHDSYYCRILMDSSEADNYIYTIGSELSYLNCDLFTNLKNLKLSSKEYNIPELPDIKRRASESCAIRLNLYSVYFT